MKKVALFNFIVLLLLAFDSSTMLGQSDISETYKEQFRPQFHFSPKKMWMNDPNGLIYYNNTYHMFFQYHPESTIWGPMHWGHAESTDLIHWTEKDIALYPDTLGYIYSGSAVMDFNNTSGLGKNGNPPMIAVFTHNDPILRKAGSNTYQNQSLAYSLDSGQTWLKYKDNPVLKNPGINDFRDPKVFWHDVSKKWIMTLATKDRVTFYSSSNLKEWQKESEFGANIGAHGGVWECPDLIQFEYNGKKIWVLIVSINPGGFNGGSATQYFVGDFNGHTFSSYDDKTRWIDFGTDNYAGVTFSNTKNKNIFIGWMSNWKYARKVPTISWRSAMTCTRELNLKKIGEEYLISSKPIEDYKKLQTKEKTITNINLKNEFDLTTEINASLQNSRVEIKSSQIKNFEIVISNEMHEELIIGYNHLSNQFYIDRSKSGIIDFDETFAKKIIAPRLKTDKKMDLVLLIDESSIELFADDGLTTITTLFFPNKKYSKMILRSCDNFLVNKLNYSNMKSIWFK